MRDIKEEIAGKLAEIEEKENKMLEIKTKGDEIELNPKMPLIQQFIEDEIVRYGQVSKNMSDDRNPDSMT